MKVCQKCKIDKPVTSFSKHRANKDGLQSRCKDCCRTHTKNWIASNPEKAKDSFKKGQAKWLEVSANREKSQLAGKRWRLANPEKVKAGEKAWRLANFEKCQVNNRSKVKMWRKNNPHKVNAINAYRRAKKLLATPLWATTELDQIQELYRIAKELTLKTNVNYQVDHIVPLNSPIVCGLHCLANLQILEAEKNVIKGNREWPDMPC